MDLLLNLQPSTPDTYPPGLNFTSFYIRSYTIQISDLRNVLNDLTQAGYDMNGLVFDWLKRLDSMEDTAYVTLRYCGQTRNRPWDRHVSDIYSTFLSDFLARFFKALGRYCSEVLASAAVQVFVDAGAELALASAHLNLREQVLIALFGDGVLNLQAGGKNVMTFTNEDQALFVSLRTDTVRSLENRTQQCS